MRVCAIKVVLALWASPTLAIRLVPRLCCRVNGPDSGDNRRAYANATKAVDNYVLECYDCVVFVEANQTS